MLALRLPRRTLRSSTQLLQLALDPPQPRFEHLALFREILDVVLS
jgi:hypothetical protein